MEQVKPASALLAQVASIPGEEVSVQTLVEHFREAGFAFMLILFAAFPALPLPDPPGISMLFGLPMALFSFQLMMGRTVPWVPKSLGQRKVSMKLLRLMEEKLRSTLKFMEKFIRPRLLFVSSPVGEKFIGLAGVICGLSVCMPIPLTHTIPSMGVVAFALGLFQRDGLVILGGIAMGLGGVLLAATVYIVGLEAVKAALAGMGFPL